jgi:hypothetical protein
MMVVGDLLNLGVVDSSLLKRILLSVFLDLSFLFIYRVWFL